MQAKKLKRPSVVRDRARSRRARGRPSIDDAQKLTQVIIKAAKQQFLERGYVASSVDSIAEEAGTTKGTLYTRFPDKSALLLAVCGEILENATRLDLGEIDETLPFRDVLRVQARAVFRAATAPEAVQLYQLIAAEDVVKAKLAPESIAIWYYWVEETRLLFERRIASGRLALTDPRRAAELFCRMVLSYVHLPAAHFLPIPDPSDFEPELDAMVLMFLGGIGRLEVET